MPSEPPPAPLAYDRSGTGAPLVLIHPLGGDRGVWEPVTPRLAERFDVIAVDMPGFGESPALPDEVGATAPALAAEVLATLDALGVEHAHVAGNSLGGWVALELAKTDRCLSVTGLCPAGFWPRPLGPRPELARRMARALVPMLGAVVRTRRGRELVLRGAVAHPERVPPAAARRLVRAYALSPGFDRANAEMRKTLFEGFDEIEAPITLAWGEHDRLVAPPRSVPAGIETAFLPGCGHVPTWDDPERVAEVIEAGAARACGAAATPRAASGALRRATATRPAPRG